MRLGLLPLFNEFKWASFAIDQGMMLCDRLLITEGSQFVAFPDIPERSDDGTLDIINDKQKQYPNKIEIIDTIREHRNYRINQCANYNRSLNYCEIGDYVISLPADTFYSNSVIDKMNRLMGDEKIDCLSVSLLMFAFGFKWTFGEQPFKVIFKKNSTLHFRPTCTPKGFGMAEVILDDISGHHYCWVKPRERMRVRMRTSGMYPNMLNWFDKNWDEFKLENGKDYPGYNGNFTLCRYEGNHPSILDNHPWRNVEDIRKI